MRPEILIVGQGLAGTLLAWELERAGLAFEIADAGHAGTASAAAAGMISPITGRRLVPSWRYETLRPIARDAYRAIEAALGVPLWREMRVRRLFADTREQEIFSERHARGEFAPWLVGHDDAGFSVNGAAHVDVERLLTASRTRWRAAGWLREEVVDVMAEVRRRRCVIDCTGLVAARAAPWAFLPWEFSKGEIITVAVERLAPELIVNRREWVVPSGPGAAWIGATHEAGVTDPATTTAAREKLIAAGAALLGAAHGLAVTGQRAGVRVAVRDKRPVAGRHPQHAALGIINALGAKGALWAPWLARLWVGHLARGEPFAPEVDVRR